MINADLKELNFTSDFDGLGISAVAAVPSGEIFGVVQIVHGMNEYKERYFDFMDYLAEQGFASVYTTAEDMDRASPSLTTSDICTRTAEKALLPISHS